MRNIKEFYDKHHTRINRYVKWLCIGFGIFALLCVIGYGIILYGGGLVVKDEDFILDQKTTIEDKDGAVLKTLYEENRKVIDTKSLPKHVKNAFIAIEDRRFYHHGGVDFKSIMRAITRDIMAGGKVEGASTITQQVSKNLFLSHDKTFMRKTKEAMASIYLERHFTKDEILDLYLNAVYFGEGAYGIETAADTYFSKTAEELSIEEAAMLAGLVKSPTAYNPIEHPEKAKTRRNVVLKSMQSTGFLSAKERVKAARTSLDVTEGKETHEKWADGYVDYVLKEAKRDYNLSMDELKRGGYRIVVNVNKEAQKIAYDAYQDDTYFPGNTDGVEGSFVLTNKNRLIALVGGRDYTLGNLNRTTVRRQPGSTMKPLAVYGPALMQKKYTPYSLLEDKKRNYNGYQAKNYDNQYDTSVSLYEALIQSKNAPAVWLLNEIGLTTSKDYLEKMNIDVAEDGLALALGGLTDGVTPIQMVDGFNTFRNGGEFTSSRAIDAIYDEEGTSVKNKNALSKKRVFSKQVAWDMTEMLRYTVTDGTAQKGTYKKALAGKTGTTQHPLVSGKTKDAWFVGYTPNLTLSVWMGYDNSDKQHYLEGGSEFPTQLAKDILSQLDRKKPLKDSFKQPKGVKDLPKPIQLPTIDTVKADYQLGGLKLVKGKLQWTVSKKDNRVHYRIYKVQDGDDKKIGETTGETEFMIDDVSLFKTNEYYVVPYDPLTKTEGKNSKKIKMSF